MKKIISLCFIFILCSAPELMAQNKITKIDPTWQKRQDEAERYFASGDLNTAVAIQGEAIDLAEQKLGKKSFEAGHSYIYLGIFSREAGLPDKGDLFVEKGIDIIFSALPETDPGRGIYSDTVAHYFKKRGNHQKNIFYLKQAVEAHHDMTKKFKGELGQTILRNNIAGTSTGKIYFNDVDQLIAGYSEEGLNGKKKSVEVLEEVLKKGKPFLTDQQYYFFMEWQANLYSTLGDYKKAESVFTDMLLQTKKIGKQDLINRAYNKLIDFYIAQGMSEAQGKQKADQIYY